MLINMGTEGSREKNIVSGTTPAVNNNPTITNTAFNARSRIMLPSLSSSQSVHGSASTYRGFAYSAFASPAPDRLAAVPRRRTECPVGCHKLVSLAEQIPQDIGCDTGPANQHGSVAELVVGRVNIGNGGSC
jgi:hypothetical protein